MRIDIYPILANRMQTAAFVVRGADDPLTTVLKMGVAFRVVGSASENIGTLSGYTQNRGLPSGLPLFIVDPAKMINGWGDIQAFADVLKSFDHFVVVSNEPFHDKMVKFNPTEYEQTKFCSKPMIDVFDDLSDRSNYGVGFDRKRFEQFPDYLTIPGLKDNKVAIARFVAGITNTDPAEVLKSDLVLKMANTLAFPERTEFMLEFQQSLTESEPVEEYSLHP